MIQESQQENIFLIGTCHINKTKRKCEENTSLVISRGHAKFITV